MARRYSKAASRDVESAMRKRKRGISLSAKGCPQVPAPQLARLP